MGEKEIIDLRDGTPGKEPGDENKQESASPMHLNDVSDAAVPEQIGPYRLIRVIAEGGMGTVYLAEQEKPIRRSVALKLIKVGMDTKEVIARFDAERQALALMDHPNIAKVLDGGATENGRPFFVMELVKGMPITRYCDEENLSTASRLELFQQVCHAVQHAHQKGIIHRDIKPSNVMVTVQDGVAVPKVIDFGIAKATNQRLTEMTLFTQFNQFIGTPEYMAPEQADAACVDVDTRADVYSLGVLLYELLTGTKPFQVKTLMEAGYDEILRHIREVTPPKPSTRIGTLGERISRLADRRQSTPRLLGRMFRGDLDWIVMKALEKEPARRYEAASSFAEDIGNYLSDRTVVASPPSVAYRFHKFARRHRVFLFAASLVAAALFTAVGILAWSFVQVKAERDAATVAQQREEEARQRAEEAHNASEAVTEFLSDMLASVSPERVGKDVTVREVLDETAGEVGPDFADRPLIEARLQHTLGEAYYGLGLYEAAEPHARRAVELRSRELGKGHEDTLRSANRLGALYHRLGRFEEAERTLGEALALNLELRGEEHWLSLNVMTNLASLFWKLGRYDESEEMLSKSLELNLRLNGEDHTKTIAVLGSLAHLYRSQGRYQEAEPLAVKFLEKRKEVSGPESPKTLHAMNNLAILYDSMGREKEANVLLEKTLEIRMRVLGEEHPDTLTTLNNMANAYKGMGRHEEAEKLYQQALEIRRRMLGDKHPHTLHTMESLAGLYRDQGDAERAGALLIDVLHIRIEVMGEDHPDSLSAKGALGILRWQEGKYGSAESLYEDLVEARRRVNGEEHPDTMDDMNFLGIIYWSQARYDQALALFFEANRKQKRVLGEEHPSTLNSANNLAMVYVDMDRFEEAEEVYLENLEIRKRVFGEEHPQTLDAMNNLGNLYYAQSRLEEAGEIHARVWEIRKALLGPDHPKTLGSAGNLASVYMDRSRFAEAEKLNLELLASETRVLGKKNPSTINTLANLAIVYRRQGKYGAAEEHQNRALELRVEVLGREHPDTLDSIFELAQIYEEQERWEESEALYSKVWKLRKAILGEAHQDTTRAMEHLAVLLANTERIAEAKPLVTELIRVRKAEADLLGASPLALHECGLLLLTCRPEALRDPDTALVYCTRANALTDYRIPEFLRYLALAYHRVGKSKKGAEFQQRALDLLPEENPDRADYEGGLAEMEEAL